MGWVSTEELLNPPIDKLTHLSEQGNSQAQFELGVLYEKGKVVDKSSLDALKLFEQAEQNNHEDACLHLAWIYDEGKIIPRDKLKALRFYQKTLDLNPKNTHALYNLGYMYEDEGNIDKARKLYEKAASLGDFCAATHYLIS